MMQNRLVFRAGLGVAALVDLVHVVAAAGDGGGRAGALRLVAARPVERPVVFRRQVRGGVLVSPVDKHPNHALATQTEGFLEKLFLTRKPLPADLR